MSTDPEIAQNADYVAVGWMCENGEHLRRVAWQRHSILSKPWCDLCFEVYRLVHGDAS
jgi:hypothetical protein